MKCSLVGNEMEKCGSEERKRELCKLLIEHFWWEKPWHFVFNSDF